LKTLIPRHFTSNNAPKGAWILRHKNQEGDLACIPARRCDFQSPYPLRATILHHQEQ
jgi:hypothetical protein